MGHRVFPYNPSRRRVSRCPLCACVLLAIFASACGSDSDAGGPSATEQPPPSTAAPTPPGKGDSPESFGYALEGPRAWYLIGNPLTPGQDTFDVAVSTPEDVWYVDLWLDGDYAARLDYDGSRFIGSVGIEGLAPGEHKALFAADGSETAFAELSFQRSHPLYVFVSNDWDDSDNPDATLRRQEQLHELHPELKLTHFVGPYTFTDSAVPASRADYLAGWVKGLRDQFGDEIGLHIHPYCNFVDTTSVTCRTEPSFAESQGDATGYTVVVGSYTRDEFGTLLRAADEIFDAHGLGKPTGFRAGGWTSEIHTLEALAENGFVADASGANWRRMEEWKDVAGTTLYAWNQEHWITIDDTSQPYYPSLSDILESAPPPNVPVLEVPDNGLLVDYVRTDEMIDIFTANWPGGALDSPRVYSIGYHPPNFSESFKSRIDGALNHVDAFLASDDRGPVVYATLSDLAQVWPPPQL